MLALITATINYLRGFPDRNKEPDANQASFWEHIFQSHSWQNFGIYALAVIFILFVLTIISFVLRACAVGNRTEYSPKRLNSNNLFTHDQNGDKLCLDTRGFMVILARSGFSAGRKPN